MIRSVNGLLVIIFDIKCINGLVYDELACIVSCVCLCEFIFSSSPTKWVLVCLVSVHWQMSLFWCDYMLRCQFGLLAN